MAEMGSIQRARRRLRRWRMRGGIGPRVVVGVSGGSDSAGLLRLLVEEGNFELTVAHLNHGVRGDDADADARFVADLAARLGLAHEVGYWRPERAGHFEVDARTARYAWLAEVARSRGANAVAVGHTRDDQAETILHRVLRGTGLTGLAGMPARRPLAQGVSLVRPLLEVTRAEVQAYLGALGQDWREDASNTDMSYTRSRLRYELLPKLASEYNPRVADALVRLGRHARAALRENRPRLERAWKAAVVTAGPEGITLRRRALARLSLDLRSELIRLAWRRAGWPEAGMTSARWLRLARLEESAGRFAVGHGIDANLSSDTLRLAPTHVPNRDSVVVPEPGRLPLPGAIHWGAGQLTARVPADPACAERIDLDCVMPWRDEAGDPYLIVRAPADGDRFSPLGMGGRSMALNDFFRGRKLSREHRRLAPIVCDQVGIVWVAGHRIAERVKQTPTTARTLGLDWRSRPRRGSGCD